MSADAASLAGMEIELCQACTTAVIELDEQVDHHGISTVPAAGRVVLHHPLNEDEFGNKLEDPEPNNRKCGRCKNRGTVYTATTAD